MATRNPIISSQTIYLGSLPPNIPFASPARREVARIPKRRKNPWAIGFREERKNPNIIPQRLPSVPGAMGE